MLQAMLNAFKLPDLRRKIIFTIGMLILFRLIAHIPVPGVDFQKLQQLFQTNQLMGMLDLFSGGAMTTFSVAAMGVYPYITSSIIMQLLHPIIPHLQELGKEGEAGRKRINQYTHWLTVPLAALQAYATATLLHSQGIITNFGLSGETLLPTSAMIMSMTAGTILLVWLGELISENGIGNGVSIIIFAGIVARLPQMLGQSLISSDYMALAFFALLGVITVGAIVVVQEAQRRIPVHYPKRIRGTRMYGGQSTYIPLRVNSAGMIPLIFAMSIMIFPGTVASYFMASEGTIGSTAKWVFDTFNTSGVFYWGLYFVLVVGFTFFYTLVIFEQQNLADNLQKYGAFVQGIRPGRPTAEYLRQILNRITWLGAIFLGIIAVLPFFARGIGTQLVLSSTGLLIVVGVVLDTMRQLESQLLMRHYEGFIR
ncbi:MAG: preprotein translocase subunit SecY [Chloroflexi bacterium]|nr:preprotein translocase subunit SecY [Chloroflexota bacterium]MCL5074953.1 preprotein translocase subunit SecY [Chloroflexota bacterium]